MDTSNLAKTGAAGAAVSGLVVVLNYLYECHAAHAAVQPSNDELTVMATGIIVGTHFAWIAAKAFVAWKWPQASAAIVAAEKTEGETA